MFIFSPVPPLIAAMFTKIKALQEIIIMITVFKPKLKFIFLLLITQKLTISLLFSHLATYLIVLPKGIQNDPFILFYFSSSDINPFF